MADREVARPRPGGSPALTTSDPDTQPALPPVDWDAHEKRVQSLTKVSGTPKKPEPPDPPDGFWDMVER